ncbi:vomeronasal 1 receptor monDomV1R1222 [Monodelphis domestica]|uniref:vomeronasal 1 receptor monDomV1R1222 n=1 Tax=Monodelphis domestica TaxID=13616 RepID=UPI0001C47962|nr:vomeronasal 1 receptor monDomV1R1222 [Monodelphis domestica]
MQFNDWLLAIVFIIQNGIGILGNSFLLFLYILPFLTGHTPRPIDSIFFNLSLANLNVLLFRGLPQTMFYLGLKNVLDLLGCKLIQYLHTVSRSVSLTTTCLLSGFQGIIISPRNSRWFQLKAQAPKYIIPSCLFCWCFYLFINFTMLGIMHNSRFMSNNTKWWHLGYCSVAAPVSFNALFFVIIYSLPDVICIGFMSWASAYLIFILHRHHQQVQHIRNPHLSARTFPETKATHASLLLVCTHVSFYSINSIITFCNFQFGKYYSFFTPTAQFTAACFPCISPFVLISYDSQLHKYFYYLWCNKSSL